MLFELLISYQSGGINFIVDMVYKSADLNLYWFQKRLAQLNSFKLASKIFY